MEQKEIKARSELSKFIEGYWSFEGDKDEEFILFPDGTLQVFFSNAPIIINENVCFPGGAYLVPMHDKPIVIQSESHLLGIRYKAFSYDNLIDTRLDLKGEKLIELSSVSANNGTIRDTLEKIKKESDIESMLETLENTSYELIAHEYHLNSDLRDKVNYILDRRGDVKINELCQEFGVSRQSIHKFFKKHLGLAAKDLASIWRLNFFFSAMQKEKHFTSGLLEAGFFDQAHGINAFKQMWGITPKQFVKNREKQLSFETQRIDRRFSNYYDPEL